MELEQRLRLLPPAVAPVYDNGYALIVDTFRLVTVFPVAVPNADRQDALVVSLTADGSVYLAGDRLSASALADRLRSIFATRNEKALYIKADARVPYARFVEVIDSVWKSGIEGLTLLTVQRDASDQASRPVPPKGLELRVVQP